MDQAITALKIQKKNQRRVSVYLDGEFAFGLSRVVAGWLEVGQVLSQERIEDLKAQDAYEVAYQKVLRYLSYRPRSEAEVRAYLKKQDCDPSVSDAVLDRLRQLELVDDRKFASAWIHNREEFRPRGRIMLQVELRGKGVPDEIITELLDGLDEPSLALRAARRRARHLQGLEWPDFRRRLSGYLSRRGFTYDSITAAVQQAWHDVDGEGTAP